MNNTNNALETLVQRDKQIKKANDKLKASINELDAELETTTNALSNHASNTEIHTSKEELIQFIVDHLESLDFTDYYTKLETNTLLEGKANSVHNHVVSDITDFPTIPTKTSELSNDSNFVTSTELHDYATKNDLNSKQDALSEEQLSNIDSIPDKANKSDLSTVATSGSYKDLSDKPVIPEGADLSDYYNKGETDNLLNSKANTSDLAVVAKSGNYNDLVNTPTIPTRTSQLINDSGFLTSSSGVITSVSWSDITNKPNFATVATSGSYNDLSNKPTIPKVYNKTLTIQKNGTNVATFTSNSNTDVTADITVPTKVSELENDMGFGTGGDTSDCVHKTGNETIDGTKTFTNQLYLGAGGGSYGLISAKDTNSILRLFGGTAPSNGANLDLYGEGLSSGGFSLRARTSDKIVGLDGKVDGTLKWNNKNVALDENLVHRTGNETISGAKIFLNDIFRKNTSADLTVTPTGYTNTNIIFTDKNDKTLAHIEYVQRPSGVNDVGIFARDKNGNAHGIHINTNNEVIPLMSSSESYSLGSATYKWGKIYSNDVVHTSGNETINGAKTFTQGITIKKSDIDLTITPTSNKYSTYLFTDKNNKSLGVVQYAQRSTDVNDVDLYVFDKNSTAHGIQITTNNELLPIGNNYSLGSSSGNKWVNVYATTFNGNSIKFPSGYYITTDTNDNSLRIIRDGTGHGNNYKVIIQGDTGKFYAPNGFIGNLQGNADSATSATKSSYLDNYSVPGMNKIYLDWDVQKKGYVGLKVDNTVMGGLITTNNIGSQAANSATYSTTPATTDNSTRIATTAWVRTYVNSVVGSNTVGSSVSAYWSNSSNVTAAGTASAHSSTSSIYPACYSDYVSKTPTVGTIYSGAQLYTVLNAYASAEGELQPGGQYNIRITTVTAQATFSNPISPTGKYLCTTANTVKFRAYVTAGNSSTVGSASVVDKSLTKSIFIRVE